VCNSTQRPSVIIETEFTFHFVNIFVKIYSEIPSDLTKISLLNELRELSRYE